MEKPQSPAQSTPFDTVAIAAEMRTEGPYEREGHTARLLVREPDLRVVLVVMKGGSIIKEHRAKQTASIHVLSGRVRVRLQDQLVDLPSARLLVLESGLAHSVEAMDESTFLLSLAWHDNT
jgi:quercetin dioxygenase-like cupin family protein